MKSYYKLTITALLILTTLLLTCPSLLLAQNVELAWDPSESEDVAGYKIYYKADSTELPLDGIEALEGPSPIDVGDVTSFTLTELPEGSVYYFRATAYDSEGNESVPSNLTASAWIPAPISPEMGATAGTPATLIWSEAPADLNLTFTLRYGTDPQLQASGATVAIHHGDSGHPSMPASAPLLAAMVCLAGLSLRQLAGRLGKQRLLALTVCLGLALSTASCGGGGGGGSDSSSPSASMAQDNDTIVVAGLTDSYYTTGDLAEGSTYYWQVIAVDGDGQEYESETSSFVAE
ncbi:MAG: hypothetical protein BA870_09975 [Desulfuromonadales bacterium C00003094]|nr:MAG: hypothetical protein BA870_09975 [Desulfuromonadales bacterium C00003094]